MSETEVAIRRFRSLTVRGSVLLLLCATIASAQQPSPAEPVITVTGYGEAFAAPDQAVVTLGAVAQADNAKAAQEQVNRIVQAIIQRIRALGIPEQRIRTSSLVLGPVYGGEAPDNRGRPQEPRIVGYRASNTVEVQVDEIARAGDVVDAGIESGANQLEGLQFRLKNDEPQRLEALRLASRSARAKAESIAEALGVTLGDLAQAVEGGVQVYSPPMAFARGEAAMAAPTPVQPGEQRIGASVTLTYRIGGAGGK